MRLPLALPLLFLAACHTPAESPAPVAADSANDTMIEQSMANSQFAVEDQIENEAVNQEAADVNLY